MFYLMRHGHASWEAASDQERPLTHNGSELLKRMISHHAVSLVNINKIICSPYLRTQQTAAIVNQNLNVEILLEPNITPSSSVKEALTSIEKHWCDGLLIVTHQPLIGCLINFLEQGESSATHFPEVVEPGSLYSYSLPWPGPACAIRESLFSV
jgi:phosphohistidine phosphatase